MKFLHTLFVIPLILLTSCELDELLREVDFNEATPLNSSVSIFHTQDYKTCQQQVSKAIALGNKSINFVLNQYADINPQNNVPHSYCSMTGNKNCLSISKRKISDFKKALKACFKLGQERNIEITILPHLDEKKHRIWRNEFRFDPLKKYQAYSYYDILLKPTIESLQELRYPGKLINFNLQGEMGATVFEYPKQYLKILEIIKTKISGSKVGISLNYNFISGRTKFSPYRQCDGKLVTKSYNRKNDFSLSQEQRHFMQTLINKVDFIGFSAYKGFSKTPEASDFENTIWDFVKEIESHHMNFPSEKEVHFSEVGIGGGAKCYDGKAPSLSYNEALSSPYSGIHTVYSRRSDPWRTPEVNEARYDYYKALGSYLGGAKRFNLKRAYLWNVSSWDFQGIYPGAENYKDQKLLLLLKEYNKKIQER